MIQGNDRWYRCVVAVFLCLAVPWSNIGAEEQPPAPSSLSLGDKLDSLGQLYRNDEDPLVQDLWVLGRFHGHYYWVDGAGQEDHGYETRRMRLGGQARVLQRLTLHAQMVSGSNLEPFYNGFTELWAQWRFSPQLTITVGQQKNRVTHERITSSRYMPYLERSMITNMAALDYTPAVTVQGEIDRLSYFGGVYSNATGRNIGDAFFTLDSGYSVIGSAYYRCGEQQSDSSCVLHGSFLHSDANDRATQMNRFRDIISPALIVTRGSASLITEVLVGVGGEGGSATGINLQPGLFLSDTVQVVGRYQLAGSRKADGLTPQRRYERRVGLPTGNRYQAGYLGLVYYLAKHRIKLMTGVEYATIGGQGAWTGATMVRCYFGPHSGGAYPMNQLLPGSLFEAD